MSVNSAMRLQLGHGARDYDSLGQERLKRVRRPAIDRLTERQKDCLRLVAQGYTSKEIGRKLDLSPSTVDNHILLATQALDGGNRAEAARLLASAEARQKLPRETLALAELGDSGVFLSAVEAPVLSVKGRRVWSLPPVGGQRNHLDSAERTIRIVQVAAVGFVTVMGLVLMIAGAFRLFS